MTADEVRRLAAKLPNGGQRVSTGSLLNCDRDRDRCNDMGSR